MSSQANHVEYVVFDLLGTRIAVDAKHSKPRCEQPAV